MINKIASFFNSTYSYISNLFIDKRERSISYIRINNKNKNKNSTIILNIVINLCEYFLTNEYIPINKYVLENSDNFHKVIRRIDVVNDIYNLFGNFDNCNYFDNNMLKIFYLFECGKSEEIHLCEKDIHDYIMFIDFAIIDPIVSFIHYLRISKFINENNYYCIYHLMGENNIICKELIIHLPLKIAHLYPQFKDCIGLWFKHNFDYVFENINVNTTWYLHEKLFDNNKYVYDSVRLKYYDIIRNNS